MPQSGYHDCAGCGEVVKYGEACSCANESEPLECLDRNGECSGEVEMYAHPPMGEKFFPRCAFHIEKRWEKFENGIEREALSDVPPAWFDPGYAGEEW